MFTYFKPTINCTSWVDRFNSSWTFFFLLILALISAIRHHLGPNVTCWNPAEFTNSMTMYVNNLCWQARVIRNWEWKDIPAVSIYKEHNEYDSFETGRTLYQWLPVILLFQALFFRLPDVLLRISDSSFGFESTKFVTMIQKYHTLTSLDRMTLAQNLSNYLNQVFSSRFCKSVPYGIVTIILAFTKLLFVINAVTQLTILEGYLSPKNVSSYGGHVLNSITNQNATAIAQSPAFPLKVLCDFELKFLQNVQRYTVNCVIPVNEFNDQLCFVVWIWLLLCCLFSTTSGVVFLAKNLFPMYRQRFASKYLEMGNITPGSAQLSNFTGKTIGQDGVFLLHMIGDVASDILVRDVVLNLWYMHEGHTSDVMGYSVSRSSTKDDAGIKIHSGNDQPPAEKTEIEKTMAI